MPGIILQDDEEQVNAMVIEFHSDWVLANEKGSDFWRCFPKDRVEEIYMTDDEKTDLTFDI